jgi:hypothetical protein
MKQTAQIIIPSTVETYPYHEFISVLNNFRGLYAEVLAALNSFEGSIDDLSADNIDRACVFVADRVSDNSIDLSIWGAVTPLSPEEDLLVLDVQRRNPIEIVLVGIPLALTAAVILSGGEFQIPGALKVKLPPIGDGIESLRRSLRPLDKSALIERTPTQRMEGPQGSKKRMGRGASA